MLVDHDVQVLREADWIIEIGPGSGSEGGTVLADGTRWTIWRQPGVADRRVPRRQRAVRCATGYPSSELFAHGRIQLRTRPLHTVHALDAEIPEGRLTAVTGMSGLGQDHAGSGESGARAQAARTGGALPAHVVAVDRRASTRVNVVDATPIGTNVRSTVATYSGVLTIFAAPTRPPPSEATRPHGVGLLLQHRVPAVPALRGHRPDRPRRPVPPRRRHPLPRLLPAPGTRRPPTASACDLRAPAGISLPALLGLTVDTGAARTSTDLAEGAQEAADADRPRARIPHPRRGRPPPLSGGEAQRLKLATELGRNQSDALFVLDEPSVGLHPLDIRVLLRVLDRLSTKGATVIVIEHDLDMIANADHVIDMGPGGGAAGGTSSPPAPRPSPTSGQRHRALSRTWGRRLTVTMHGPIDQCSMQSRRSGRFANVPKSAPKAALKAAPVESSGGRYLIAGTGFEPATSGL